MASVPKVVVVMTVVMLMVGCSQAYDFYVGGRDGWVQHPAESYAHWAERNRFQVNDRLVFKFKPGEDSVLVVNKEDYDACDTSKPIQRLDNGDFSVLQFDRSGPFFFISGAPGRCQAGQKLVVVVLAVRHPNPTSPPPPTAAPSPPTAPSAAPSPSTAQPSAPPTKGPPSELPPAPAPAERSGSSSTGASFRRVALVLALGGGAFLLW